MPKFTEAYIAEINRAESIKDYLTPSAGHPREYACPFCGSSHHVEVYPNNTATCHKCHKAFDLITAKREKEGSTFREAVQDIADRHNLRPEYEGDYNGPSSAAGAKEPETVEEMIIDPPEPIQNTPEKYKDEIASWTANAGPAREYMKTRGFSDTLLDLYEVGYTNTYFVSAGASLPAVTFSYNVEHSYYGARSLDGKHFTKPKTEEAGEEPLFRPEQLNEKVCYVVESQTDALSVIQAGAPAVALCGTGYNKLLPAVKDRKTPLILFLDNDKEGKKAQAALAEELKRRGIPYRIAVFKNADYKDANDRLRADPEQFKREISANAAAALDPTGIEEFLLTTRTEKFKPVPTGIENIDSLLKGGLMPGTLTLVGSPPGGGKTALCAQIFESMAEAGRLGIYVNMEMAKEQLIARSLARRVYIRNNSYKLSALDILRSYSLTEKTKLLVQEAADEYKEAVGDRLLYNPEGVGPDLDEIIKYINDIAQRGPAPNICIDYLHLLTGAPGEDTASILKRAVFALKEYATRYNAIVVAIEAQNREANRSKEAILEAGRDSSGLEYGGDLILSLVRKDPELHPEEINLCITKSRFTGTNFEGYKYILHGAQSYMEPAFEKWQKLDKMPF